MCAKGTCRWSTLNWKKKGGQKDPPNTEGIILGARRKEKGGTARLHLGYLWNVEEFMEITIAHQWETFHRPQGGARAEAHWMPLLSPPGCVNQCRKWYQSNLTQFLKSSFPKVIFNTRSSSPFKSLCHNLSDHSVIGLHNTGRFSRLLIGWHDKCILYSKCLRWAVSF